MAVNTIDAVFPPNSNYFLLTLKHRPLPHSKQDLTRRQPPQPVPSLFFYTFSLCCNALSCAVGAASLFDAKQMQQCTNSTERHHFGKGLQSSLIQQINYAASLRPIVHACDEFDNDTTCIGSL
eukprot:3839764-Pleurochrysis_carterae.AAC.1